MCFAQFIVTALVFAHVFLRLSTDLIILVTVTTPISIKLAYNIKNNQYQKSFQIFFMANYISNCSMNELINTIRSIVVELDNFQTHYLIKAQGVLYENMLYSHKQNCSLKSQTCFCSLNQNQKTNNLLYIEEISELHKRREQIENVVFALIKQFAQQSEKRISTSEMISLHFYLIHFFIEILKDPVKMNIEIYKMHLIYLNKMSPLQKFYFFQLKEEINVLLNEANAEKQKKSMKVDMIGVILFDEQMSVLKVKLKNQLIGTGVFYDYLQSNKINLNQIQIQSALLHKKLKELEQIMVNLYQINPFNIDLQYLTTIFVQVLDIKNRKISDFQKQPLSSNKQKTQSKFLNKDYFNENSCMVYCSLIDTNYSIDKVSANFKNIFNYSNDQVIGKPLSILLPRIVKETHNQIIDFCIKFKSNKLQSQGERFSFGVDEKGFIFPLTIQLRFDQLEKDFGVCALISRIKQKKQYILFADDGTITDFSKRIFVDLFQTTKYSKQGHFSLHQIFDQYP